MKLPKPGDVVAVEWLDSGLELHGTLAEAASARLAVCVAYGRVISADERQVALAHDEVVNGEGTRNTCGVIATACIRKVTVYQRRRVLRSG